MFSNRAYGWKLGAALALIAVLGVYAAQRGEGINPALWRCVVEPRRWDNTTIWLPIARVLSVGGSDFEVAAGDARIRVVGQPPAGVGARLSLRGVFRADGPRLEMIQARTVPDNLERRRLLMEVVSILVALAVIANFVRHFALRTNVLQVHRRSD